MADSTDLTDTIADAALQPKSATVDGVAMVGTPVPEIIQADQYLAAKSAAKKKRPFFGARVQKLSPPGAT